MRDLLSPRLCSQRIGTCLGLVLVKDWHLSRIGTYQRLVLFKDRHLLSFNGLALVKDWNCSKIDTI